MVKKKQKNTIFETALVEKRNILNEIRNNNMSTQELRFFSIYLSMINARDPSTRVVRLLLADFQKIMEFQTLNLVQLRNSFVKLLQQVVSVPNENGRGFSSFQLFKRCKLLQDDYLNWYIEIDAHDDALPLMFEFKKNYFTYELWNALRLKSSNQIRMYEILKQYEYIGKREMTVTELRELLGIAPNEYLRWDNFKKDVLNVCQQALSENTDICFTYEKGKSGTGGKWITIIFRIFKNENYKDPLTLDKFIDLQPQKDIIAIETTSSSSEISNEYIELYDKYFKDRKFTKSETESILKKFTEQINSNSDLEENIEFYLQNLIAAYDEQLRHQTLNNKVGYLIGMIKNNAFLKTEPTYRQREETSYDINEFEKYAINYEEFSKVEYGQSVPISEIDIETESIQYEKTKENNEKQEMSSVEPSTTKKNYSMEEIHDFLESIRNKS